MKKLLVGALVLCLSLSMVACGGGSEGGDSGAGTGSGSESGSGDGIVGRVDKMLSSQGRSYDELVTGKVGDTLTCTFFEFSISNVETKDELDGYKPNTEGNKFVTADVAVKNIFTDEEGKPESIPVGNYDFTIIWSTEEETAEEDHYAYASFMDGMYPDDVTLAGGESLSGKLVFEIPAGINDFGISYVEIFDDEFKGDTYVVECAL